MYSIALPYPIVTMNAVRCVQLVQGLFSFAAAVHRLPQLVVVRVKCILVIIC